MVEVYVATIVWNGEEREEEVLATGRRPLVGTLLLNGSELNVQFVEGGLLSIETM
jgi:predicted aspartyl protease